MRYNKALIVLAPKAIRNSAALVGYWDFSQAVQQGSIIDCDKENSLSSSNRSADISNYTSNKFSSHKLYGEIMPYWIATATA